jgi:hypothetical protein
MTTPCPFDPKNPPTATQKWAVYEALPGGSERVILVTENEVEARNYAKSIAGRVALIETVDTPSQEVTQ